MSEINFSSGNKIAEAIDKRIIAIAKQVANKSTVNKTVFGRVTAKNNGLFSLRINNTVYTNVIALKNSNYINVGDKVVCLVPNNQFNDLLILGVADGSLLATSEYTLNQASSTELGGIKANNRTVEDQEVRIDPNTGFLYYSLGKSIESIEKTSTSGLVDTYTITYTDGTYTTFTVTNADQIDIQYVNGQLQWKYASETAWTTLFSVDGVLSTTSVNPIQNQVVTNAINNISNNINNNVVENISTSVTGDNFSLIQTLINLNTQATTQQSVNLPLANASAAGLMSSSDFSSLQDLEDRVGNLEGKTTRLLYTASTNPTASDINSFVTGLGYTSPFEGIAVVVDETFHIWHYYDNNGIGWRDDGVDTVSNFTNSTAGIILGSTNNGKVFAETDGTGSVNGWDTLNTNVSNLQSTTQNLSSSVSNLGTQVETNATNITNLQNNKIDINQGSSNTGKVLTVGSDGNVVPQDIPSSGGTIVNIANVPQGTVNFTSDPQSQLDDLKNIFITLTENSGTLTQEQFDTLDGDDNNYIILTIGSNSWIYRLTEKDSQYSIYMRTARVYPINFGGFTLGVDYVSINRNTLSYTIDTLCPYPMGSIYISVENVSPAGIVGGTWEALGEGYTLWTTTTSGQGGQTIEAGLPNIEGNVYSVWNSTTFDNTSTYEGALSLGEQVTIGSQGGSGYNDYLNSLGFDASQSNSIYGNSTTVQPPAIKVYMWKRVS